MRSDGGELTDAMKRCVDHCVVEAGYRVNDGEELALDWGRLGDLGLGEEGMGGEEVGQMVSVHSGSRVVARIALGGVYNYQDGKAEAYVENGRMVEVWSFAVITASPKGRQEIYVDEAGILVLARERELPYRREGEGTVVLTVRHTVKARRIAVEARPEEPPSVDHMEELQARVAESGASEGLLVLMLALVLVLVYANQ